MLLVAVKRHAELESFNWAQRRGPGAQQMNVRDTYETCTDYEKTS